MKLSNRYSALEEPSHNSSNELAARLAHGRAACATAVPEAPVVGNTQGKAGTLCVPDTNKRPDVSLLEHASGNIQAVDSATPVTFDVVLDSGAAEHVADNLDAPGYEVDASKRVSSGFTAANGEPIENKGQMTLNLVTTEGHPIQSVFQVCEVSRPLWSVSRICDAGCSVTFTAKGATVTHMASGKNMCNFERKRNLYVASLPLKRPEAARSFPRQGQR